MKKFIFATIASLMISQYASAASGLFKCVTIMDIPISVKVSEVKSRINGELLSRGMVASFVLSRSTLTDGNHSFQMNRYNISVESVYGQFESYGQEIKTSTKSILDSVASSYTNGYASFLTCTFTPEI